MVSILQAKVKKYEAENAAARGRVKAYVRRQTNRDKEEFNLLSATNHLKLKKLF